MADTAIRSPARPEAVRDLSHRALAPVQAPGLDALTAGISPDTLGALKASRIAGAGYAVPMTSALLRAQRLYGNQAVQRMVVGSVPAPTHPARRPSYPSPGATDKTARADQGSLSVLVDS